MIRHICMFTLKEENKAEHLAELLRRAETLRSIDTLRSMDVVTNDPATPASNYDFALICDFDDVDGLNAYQTSPQHIAFGQYLGTVRDARACIDYRF